MDPRLLEYYNRELQFVREMGAEFSEAYPRIAARLGIVLERHEGHLVQQALTQLDGSPLPTSGRGLLAAPPRCTDRRRWSRACDDTI